MKDNYRKFVIFLFITWMCWASVAYSQPWAVEGKLGAFIPTSHMIRNIFTAMPFVELEGSYRFAPAWDVWAGVGCIFGQGESLGCKNSTALQVIPFTLGLRCFFPLTTKLSAYLGIGGMWSLYENQDHSSHVHRNISQNGFGGIFKGGGRYQLKERIFASVFVEYMIQHFSFHKVYDKHFTYRHDVNMDGIKCGLGIVYEF